MLARRYGVCERDGWPYGVPSELLWNADGGVPTRSAPTEGFLHSGGSVVCYVRAPPLSVEGSMGRGGRTADWGSRGTPPASLGTTPAPRSGPKTDEPEVV